MSSLSRTVRERGFSSRLHLPDQADDYTSIVNHLLSHPHSRKIVNQILFRFSETNLPSQFFIYIYLLACSDT